MVSFQPMVRSSFWFIVFCFITGCKNQATGIPFPSDQTGFLQPASEPVQLTIPVKMIPPKKDSPVKSVITSLDLDKLPVSIYDSSDFISFPKPPHQSPFDMALLPSKPFAFQDLPSKHFTNQLSFLEQPRLIKVERPHLVSSSSSLTYEFGQPLMGTRINCLLKDKAGFLWIAADQGVYRYDGENLLMILSDNLATGSTSMAEDRNGKIWIATRGNGVLGIDFNSGTYSHITTRQGLASNDIVQIFIDHQGFLWLAESSNSSQEGLDIIDMDSVSIKHLGKQQGLSSDLITSIVQDDQDNIWISNRGKNGINILDLKNNRIKFFNYCNGLDIDAVSGLLADHKGRIWMGGEDGKLNAFDRQKGMVTHYNADQGLKNGMIDGLMEDTRGKIWIGTGKNYFIGNVVSNGVEELDPDRGMLKIINTINGLSANDIGAMAEDKLGQIWIASVNGLNMVRKNGSDIVHIGKSGMYCLAQDSSGLIWICTPGQGIDILDLTTGFVRSVTTKQGLHSNVMENDLEMGGRMFVSTMKGLEIADPSKKTLEYIGEKQGLSKDQIGAMINDRQGRIWIGFYPGVTGVDLFDPIKMSVVHFRKEQGIEPSIIMEIRQDSQGMIWLAHVDGSIDIIDPEKMTISKLIYHGRFTKSHWSDMSMVPDARGNMWVGSDGGIYVVNEKKDSLRRISFAQGLAGNYILSLNQYGDQVYAGTVNGLSVFTLPPSPDGKWKVESFGNSDGFRKLANNFATDFISRKGQFFWLDLGITYFNIVHAPQPQSLLYITGIEIFNHPQYFSRHPASQGRISNPYNIPNGLQLPYDSNRIQFRYALTNAVVGDAVQYRYILEGADKNWSESTTSSVSPNYLNLQHGNYVFKVAGKGRSNQWSQPASFSFTILTPWWQSWWFYSICVLILFSGFYIFYRIRVNQILKLQNIRNSIAADLHDDIGSTLSSISIMSELARGKSTGSVTLLDSIGESASMMQESLRDMVWAVNPKNDSFANILQRMNQFATEILEARGIMFQFNYDEAISTDRLSMVQRKKLYLYFKEAINNAAKYSNARIVKVQITCKNNIVRLIIQDDGVGFDTEMESQGNGLANFNRRAEELGGQSAIRSSVHEGTRIQLTFKIT